MSKVDTKKIAREYVLKHQEHYEKATKKEIDAAVTKIAKALAGLKAQQTNGAKAMVKKRAA